ncbi:sensor histidine kinase [Crocinitomix algicola]|uniref:sensor histidine kinase n=1 Tax=Crocinitomix algicola TaxID=1740263 RepID=UPI0008354699|nr:histidine kinase [Crocinitomix algicola]
MYHFTIGEEELANLDIYSIYYDEEQEQIYIGTNSGLYTYSQSTIHKLTLPKERVGNSYFDLKVDGNGDLFCKNLNGQVFQIFRDSLSIVYTLPEEYLSEQFGYYFDSKNNLWCYANRLVKVNRKNVKNSKVYDFSYLVSISEVGDNEYVLGMTDTTLGNTQSPEGVDFKYTILKTVTPAIRTKNNDFIFYRYYGEPRRTFVKMFSKDGVYKNELKIDGLHSIEKVNDTLFTMNGVRSGVSFLRYENDSTTISRRYFSDKFISAAHLSKNGTLFLGTFKKGLIVVPNKSIEGVILNELGMDLMYDYSGQLFVRDRSGVLMAYQFNKDNQRIEKESVVASRRIHISQYKVDGQDFPGLFFLLSATRDAVDLGAGYIGIVTKDGISAFNAYDRKEKGLACFNLDENNSPFTNKRLFHIAADSIGRNLYVSGSKGLYTSGYDTVNFDEIKLNEKSLDIADIKFSSGYLFCGTYTKGVVIIKDNEPLVIIDKTNGLLENRVLQVDVQDSKLYVLSSGGLQVFDMKEQEFIDNETLNLVGNSITKFDIWKDKLAFFERNSFYTMELGNLDGSSYCSRVYLDSVRVNNTRIDTSKKSFRHNENSLSFYVDFRNAKTLHNVSIQYMLEGFLNRWNTLGVKQHKIEFLSLSPGDYSLKIRAKNGTSLSTPLIYRFTIRAPFWQRWWFYLSIIVISIGVVSWLFYSKLKQERIRTTQEIKLERSNRIATSAQLKAIRAQMNPHFIFNAINSIQHLVLENEKIKSYDYLESFSSLVRMMLDFSEREFILLEEEVDFLKLYLELESLRFNENFNYTLSVEDSLMTKTVPSLIVQPFIENAIKHGVLHKDGEKMIAVRFAKYDKDRILCEIEDNGVGREKVKEIMERRGSRHSSFATNAIKNRLKMLNEHIGIDGEFKIIDLYDEKGKAKGTCVKVLLPIIIRE